MKNTMKSLSKRLAVFLLACLLLSSFILPAAAKEDTDAIVFEFRSDGMLSDGERVFAPLELPLGCKLDEVMRYVFDTESMGYEYDYYAGATRDADILWRYFHSSSAVFVTEDAWARIEALAAGNAAERRLVFKRTYLSAQDTEDILSLIVSETDAVVTDVPVADLRDAGYFELRSYEESGVVYTIDAMIFLYGDAYGYLDLCALDNSHFDADGNLSFRSGSVPLVILGTDTVTALCDAVDRTPITEGKTVWQSDDTSGIEFESSGVGLVFFWITVVFCGFVLPGAALILGILLAVTGQKKKRWWALVICATVWLLAAIGILIILF